mmetsp:Transcript_1903/g.2107  ORF Transcript_1903/g.2107 Transcript_1903/m.2107 type:complete len:346 (+) Transcript_1903:122-1159(+)|eukprot:CAMPEP_0197848238 /NCGR_PEP_ID=MMETSP1438-20131217/8011_1 /TAXON_ID=1461541 /ORGANISM="Pterosperma sp., Strain CCMP1384" /LENGTH=345 /DNA_ID=CAMNT_0043460383 /DNA_START=114 /DNA_END=1151 /DNA_ORIENTATION=+
MSDGAEKTASKEPKYTRFTQQELPACRPLLTPTVVIAIFFFIGVVFVPIGAICLQASNSVVEVSRRYDDFCLSEASTNSAREAILLDDALQGEGKQCLMTITIEEDMDAPVFFYYELNNFYQNHRRYVKSRSDVQLRGDEFESADLAECPPQKNLGGDSEKVINPCGLVAWSYFNDTFSFELMTGGTGETRSLEVNDKGIAWPSDVNEKFGDYQPTNFNTDPALRGGGTIDGSVKEDEHFIVWMRTATLPNFRKLWGKIEQDLKKGDKIDITIQNRYNTYRFDGKKKVVLSTASWLGGKNDFLGIAYLVVGAFCLALGIVFLIIHLKNPRPLGDTSYLSWKQVPH